MSAPAAALETRSLDVARGRRQVLHGVTLAIPAGAWTAIVGANGAGKSTLLAALAGLLAPSAGEVRLRGQPLPAWPTAARARELAWLGQHGEAHGDLAAYDVVMLGRLPHQGLAGLADAADRAAVQAAMRETGCDGLAHRRLDALSGGERQRVLLARALAVQAPVLLLDEPTTHLDAPHQRTLWRGLRERARGGATVVTVLHDLGAALGADRVVVVDAGRVLAEGAGDDPRVHAALAAAFGDAIDIVAVPAGDGPARWAVLPRH
jgi:iron complex transport system ATP-binding protein